MLALPSPALPRQVLTRAICCVALLGGFAAAEAAQFVPLSPPVPVIPGPPPLPLAASLEAPVTEVQNASTTSTPPGTLQPTFIWSQGGLLATSQQPLDARYFMICLQARGSTGCHWGGRWYAPANTIPRAQVFNNFTHQPIPNRFRYTYRVPSALRLADLDLPLEWIVGSCADQRTDACTLSPPRPVLFTTRNLKAQPLFHDFTTSSAGVTFVANLSAEYVEGSGRTAPNYGATIAVFEARLGSNNRCLKTAVLADDQALLRDGSAIPANQVTDPTAVVAILPGPNPQIAVNSVIVVPQVGASIAVGTNGTVMWNGPAGKAFAVVGYLDTSSAIAEYDESDNVVVDCEPVPHP